MEELEGRIAVVTGAGRGLGEAMARRLAREGMALVLADVDDGALASVAASLHGTEVLAVPTDVSSRDAVAALGSAARERFGTVHLLCNNAGVIGRWSTAWETSANDWHRVVAVNLWGVVHGIQEFVPDLVAQDEGHVVNTASLASWRSAPGTAPYAATKHAVLGMSEVLRLELAAQGSAVGVSALCPSFLHTGILDGVEGGDDLARVRAAIERAPHPDVLGDVLVDGIRTNRFLLTEDPISIEAAADRRAAIARGKAP